MSAPLTEQEVAEFEELCRRLIRDWRRLQQTEVWTENFRLWNENDDLRRVAEELAGALQALRSMVSGLGDLSWQSDKWSQEQVSKADAALTSAAKAGIGVKK